MKETEDWIAEQPDRELARMCVRFARCMNEVDDGIAKLLAMDCRSISQMRFEDIEGRFEVASHFESWLVTEWPRSFAELAHDPQDGKPCVLCHVRDSFYGRPGLGEVRSFISLVLDDDGLIGETLAVSLAPHPLGCGRTGIFPGLTEEDLRREKAFVGHELPRVGNEVLVFVLPQLLEKAQPFVERVSAVCEELGFPRPELRELVPHDEDAARYGAVASPTVVLAHEGRRVRLIEGAESAEQMLDNLSSALIRASTASPPTREGHMTTDQGECGGDS